MARDFILSPASSILIGDSFPVVATAQSWTVWAWIFPRTTPAGGTRIFQNIRNDDNATTVRLYMATLGTHRLAALADYATTDAYAESPDNTLVLNSWNFVAAVHSAPFSSILLYRGDIATPVAPTAYVTQTPGAGGHLGVQNRMRIGNRADNGAPFNGPMERCGYSLRQLTQDELERLRRGFFLPDDGTLKGQWPLTSPDVTTIHDLSPLRQNGLPANLTVVDGPPVGRSFGGQPILVGIGNSPPTAKIVAPATVTSGSVGNELRGDDPSDPSFDPDAGDTLSYAWSQTLGPAVTFTTATNIARPQYTAPVITVATDIRFQLIVTDNHGLASQPVLKTISVVPLVVGFAEAYVDILASEWPLGVAQIELDVEVFGCASGEGHHLDVAGIQPGLPATWSRGGLLPLTALYVDSSDDGGASWQPFGSVQLGAPEQTATVNDEAAPSGRVRLYRTRTRWTSGTSVLNSKLSDPSSASLVLVDWWLKDTDVPNDNTIIEVDTNPPHSYNIDEQLAVFHGLGRKNPVVVADYGAVGAEPGSMTISVVDSRTPWSKVKNQLTKQKVLLLQSPFSEQWYIRITSRKVTIDSSDGSIRKVDVEYEDTGA